VGYTVIGVILALAGIILPVLAIVSILNNKFEGNEKLLWIIVVVILPYLGSILYFGLGRRN
jgi:hypothetical protein